jgi:Fe2+ or Zn2+ uptake regulation protein
MHTIERKGIDVVPREPLTNADFRERFDEASRILREHGLRTTRPRLAVLAVLIAACRPLSAPELIAILASTGIDFTTVYRALDIFVSEEIARAVGTLQPGRRFEIHAPFGAPSFHPHVQCRRCGIMACLEQGLLPAPALPFDHCGFLVERTDLYLLGWCAECRAV